jgi:hypothetical protein
MVLNAHLRATLKMSYIAGSDGAALKTDSESWAQIKGTWTEFTVPVYDLNMAWFLLHLVSAIVLNVCTLANVILRTMIYISDFLGSVSALTRDSNYIHVTSPESTLDGTDRSKLLRYKRVMVQGVCPNKAIGRIPLSDAP